MEAMRQSAEDRMLGDLPSTLTKSLTSLGPASFPGKGYTLGGSF